MTSILIKSFNRPFYLDRCLLSIKRYVSGWSEIRVLDDGTPAPLLEEVRRRHPEIDIIKSAAWAEKALASCFHDGGWTVVAWDGESAPDLG